MNRKVLIWEIAGIVFITIVGSLFHFVFEWTGNWAPIGGFFAVNESVWEHLKLPFWSLFIFALIEYPFIRKNSENFIIGKASAVLISITTILLTFYSYTSIFQVELLIVDILSFVIGVIIGQIISYQIIIRNSFSNWYKNISWIVLFGLGIIFIVFTYIPPHLPLFLDSNTGLYGIITNL
ncbi:MAG: DUF6512 family protein [Promethearchaeota archaeon]